MTGVDVEHTKALEQVATDGGWAIWRDLDNGFYVVGEESGVIPEGADHVDGEHNPVAHVYIATDAAFIVHARTAVPALVAAVERVQALHTPDDSFCTECHQIYPCDTRRALGDPCKPDIFAQTYDPISSPGVPAATETGPWGSLKDVPAEVSEVRDVGKNLWRRKGGNWEWKTADSRWFEVFNPRAADECAPFVAAEG